jgi:hypothetical protein
MEGPTQETIDKALLMARDIADQVWKEGKWTNEKYKIEKRRRNREYDPKGNVDNFCFYLGQFDIIRQLSFVTILSKKTKDESAVLLKIMVLAYYGITVEELLNDTSPKDGETK